MKTHRLSRRTREAFLGYALVLPSLLIFGTFVFYPFIKNIWLGFYRSPPSPLLPRKWVGLEQFGHRRAFRADRGERGFELLRVGGEHQARLHQLEDGLQLGEVLRHQRICGRRRRHRDIWR